MIVKRILLVAPLVLTAFLMQSYFWVPTYEEQTKGNPARLTDYITASIGDAGVINPILSADSASSQIESMIFEGLIDRDEQLRFRGRIAKSWEIHEEAYFCVNEEADVPGIGRTGPGDIVRFLERAVRGETSVGARLRATLDAVESIALIDPSESEFNIDIDGPTRVKVRLPHRVKLVLSRVDQDLFKNLEEIMGAEYFNEARSERFIATEPALLPQRRGAVAAIHAPVYEHNPVITFHLREGVRFHDGHPLTAEDVRFTYEAIINPKSLSPRVPDYEPVKAVEAVDPLTVRVVYKRLYSPALGTWAMGILPEHLLNDKALEQEALRRGRDPAKFGIRQSEFNRRPVGSGPFVFEEWRSDQFIFLTAFENYWEGAPNYKRYLFRIIPDILTQEMEFYAGTVDSYGVQPHQVERLGADKRYQSFSGTAFGYTYIGYNMRRSPFEDARVRRALGMAIDVDKIIEFVLYGQGERITGPFVKQTDYYNTSIKPLSYDPEGALKLLSDAGWQRGKDGRLEKDGKKLQFTLITNSGNDLRKAALAVAQDAWKRIGVDVRTDVVEWSVFIQERINKLDFDAVILGWQMGIEPDLYQIWHSSQVDANRLNFVGFKNSEADDLIVRIRQEYDHSKQVEYCHRLHEIIAEEQPYTFLYVGRWTAVLDRRIVIRENDSRGNAVYRKIRPTKTGNYTFHFNRWIKLKDAPVLLDEG